MGMILPAMIVGVYFILGQYGRKFHTILWLLLFRGLHHDSKNPAVELWGDKSALRPLYRAILDHGRYHFIQRCLSFHDPAMIRLDYTDDRFAKMWEVL